MEIIVDSTVKKRIEILNGFVFSQYGRKRFFGNPPKKKGLFVREFLYATHLVLAN